MRCPDRGGSSCGRGIGSLALNGMTEFDYDLFKNTVAEEPLLFEGKHLTFLLYNGDRVSELMQAEYAASTWPDVVRDVESRRYRGISSTDHRLVVMVETGATRSAQ